LLKIAENWFSIIFYSNIINFSEKLQETKIYLFINLFSSYRALRIFSEFFNTIFSHVVKMGKMQY